MGDHRRVKEAQRVETQGGGDAGRWRSREVEEQGGGDAGRWRSMEVEEQGGGDEGRDPQSAPSEVDGVNLEEIREFAKAFKIRRLSLGLTQTQVGQALSAAEGPAYSQSAICSKQGFLGRVGVACGVAAGRRGGGAAWRRGAGRGGVLSVRRGRGPCGPVAAGGVAAWRVLLAPAAHDALSQHQDRHQKRGAGGRARPPAVLWSWWSLVVGMFKSQTTRFEKLDITPKSAQKIKPVLERWMAEAEARHRSGMQNLTEFIGSEPSKKRKRRTSFTPQALEILNSHFEKNTHPSGQEMTEIAEKLNYDREVSTVPESRNVGTSRLDRRSRAAGR
ncbi:hypothetical protein CRUP_026299 [Coryphaenoides rupestris]|nr:hypothetical protein CRUP_026299 [Coryphaenoides rupestris]